ncbi:MAG: hypothetical protein IPO09_06385 [Anaeromyxobacter sp.]|nr:hypothetical protein [Anaeromyxobacter sp.]
MPGLDPERTSPSTARAAVVAALLLAAPAVPAVEVLEETAPLSVGRVVAAGLEPLSAPRSLGFTGRPAWVRLRTENRLEVAAEHVLAWEWPLVERLDVFVPDGRGGFLHHVGGLAVPLEERTITQAARSHLRFYRLGPGEALDAWVRVETRGPMLLEGGFVQPAEVVRQGATELFWFGAWSGALALLIAASLWSWRVHRDPANVVYAAFGLTFGAYQLDMAGVLPAAVPWLAPWAVWLEPVLGGAAAAAGVAFTRRYLGLGRSLPRLDALLRVLGWVSGVASAPVLVGAVVVANQLTSVTGGVAVGLCLVLSVAEAVRGNRAAKDYLVGFVPFALAGSWYVGMVRGQFPPHPAAPLALQATFLFTGLAVALALWAQRRAEELQGLDYLEAAVTDRTRALDATVARLGAAQRLEAVGRLTAGVAHDFNNLLTAIAASVGEVEEGGAPGAPAGPALQEIRGLVRRGGELTRSLLQVARRQPLQPHPVALNGLVQELVRLLERLMKGVALQLELDAATGTVVADPVQLEQVVLNLVLNARDACDGRGRVVVATRRLTRAEGAGGHAGGEWVQLSVSDDGPGLDEATRARIFEPFFTTKGEGQGTGLGLSVVDGVARAHGGFVEVASTPGQGATFQVWLPAGGAPRQPEGRTLTPPPGGALTVTGRSVT